MPPCHEHVPCPVLCDDEPSLHLVGGVTSRRPRADRFTINEARGTTRTSAYAPAPKPSNTLTFRNRLRSACSTSTNPCTPTSKRPLARAAYFPPTLSNISSKSSDLACKYPASTKPASREPLQRPSQPILAPTRDVEIGVVENACASYATYTTWATGCPTAREGRDVTSDSTTTMAANPRRPLARLNGRAACRSRRNTDAAYHRQAHRLRAAADRQPGGGQPASLGPGRSQPDRGRSHRGRSQPTGSRPIGSRFANRIECRTSTRSGSQPVRVPAGSNQPDRAPSERATAVIASRIVAASTGA